MKHSNFFTFSKLLTAYKACREHKRYSRSAVEFAIGLEKKLFTLLVELHERSWRPGRYSCFAITDPKLREVWAAPFCDRVVHHLLASYLEPIFERQFIFHSYACRKNKGSHLAIAHLRKAIGNGFTRKTKARPLYYLQTDIQGFFVSIDKNILFAVIKKFVKNPEALWLAEKIICQNPTVNCRISGNQELLAAIPAHKSLFHSPSDHGLPIGNLTSQFFANIYLNELDQFIKHQLKCRHYFRYMDDLVMLSADKQELDRWRDEIAGFLENNLKLKLHPKKQLIQAVTNGINFLGYIIKPDYVLVRRRTVKKLKAKLWRFNQKIIKFAATRLPLINREVSPLLKGRKPLVEDFIFNERFSIFDSPETLADFKSIFASINSTYGSFKHANCYSLRKSIYKNHFGILKIYLKPADKNYSYFCWDEHTTSPRPSPGKERGKLG